MHHAGGAQLAEHSDDDLADRPDRLRQLLLADRDDQFRRALGRDIEQMPGYPLANGREGAAWNLIQETDRSFALLAEEGLRHAYVVRRRTTRDAGRQRQHLSVYQRLDR